MYRTHQNQVAEITMSSAKTYQDPFNEISLFAVFTAPNGSIKKVPAFWEGGDVWRIRYSSTMIGIHRFVTKCSDGSNAELNGLTGEVEVTPYIGESALSARCNSKEQRLQIP